MVSLKKKVLMIICICMVIASTNSMVFAVSSKVQVSNGGYDTTSLSYSAGSIGGSVGCNGKTSTHAAWVSGSHYDLIAGAYVRAGDDSGLIDGAYLIDYYLSYHSFYRQDSNTIFNKSSAYTEISY